MNYYLMNKDKPLISFSTKETFGETIITNEVVMSKVLPLGFVNMDTWISQRNYSKHKEHMKKWLKEWKIDTTDGFLQITHALGLNDTLWVKTEGSSLTWNAVNLYENDFTDISCKTAFEEGLYGLQLSTTSPEFTTDGSFPKCWIKEDKEVFILKQGQSGAINLGNEPYSEYISSKIGNQIFENVIDYDLVMYNGKLCTKCELFTDQKYGYLPFSKYADMNRTYSIPTLINFFSDYDYQNKTDFESQFKKMILLDSIVFNTDRHLSNFGFLFKNDSFEIVNLAPNFDFNYSFLTTLTIDDLKEYRDSFVKYDIGHKLGGDFDKVGIEIAEKGLKNLMPQNISIPVHSKYNMSKERMNLLNDIFYENYEIIRKGYATRKISVSQKRQ